MAGPEDMDLFRLFRFERFLRAVVTASDRDAAATTAGTLRATWPWCPCLAEESAALRRIEPMDPAPLTGR